MSKELIAKARALAVTGGARDKTIRALANLAESEGKRADAAVEQIRNARDLWYSENGDGEPTVAARDQGTD